ncbi:bifunctional 3'-5' exonuclease/ATP-dependent helicase WRN-like [Corticium candelabrum]|uniref:bifunctional 3'-5' exonuclease/ATP-dependent helicase WRN-like n=1 Tax=Corticium candelabrum TaxID=121492 RepID=UPI002E267DDF|nr:bifunctional 3'-5' exonuclease/ATP-dependent helicase WRN-like [Corticium candelabrum]
MALPSEDRSCHVRSSISDDAMTIAIDRSCPQFDIASVKPLQRLALSQLVRGASQATDKEIKAGKFEIVFGSPEILVGQKTWRLALQEGVFRDRVVAIVADEVHTVVQWGGLARPELVEEDEDEPFRVWCGLVGELRSLVCAPILALTATASKATQEIIVSCLGMSGRCYVITKSPERDNIFLAVQRVRSDVEATFDFLLRLVKSKQINCPRVTSLTGQKVIQRHKIELWKFVENAGQLFTVQDIQALTPVFTVEHAQNILTILNEVSLLKFHVYNIIAALDLSTITINMSQVIT